MYLTMNEYRKQLRKKGKNGSDVQGKTRRDQKFEVKYK